MPAIPLIPPTQFSSRKFAFYLVLLVTYFIRSISSVSAAEAQCAEIKFSLSQKASFERQAFDARLTLDNGSPLPLTDVNVELQFLDVRLQPVLASLESTASQAKFFYQLLAPNIGLTTVAPRQTQTLHWQIIPASGAALRVNTRYYLAATVSYTQGERREKFDIKPVAIMVKPLPELTVDYFLPTEVYGDDPFTAEIEAPIPFTLGVRVKNSGASPSIATTIESAQPVIRENKQHLLTQWTLLSTMVGTQPAERSMQLNLGDIANNATSVGRWVMTSQLSGKFVDFSAVIRHGDHLGGELTSVVKQTRSWPLLHDVLDTGVGKDDILDFLVVNGEGLSLLSSTGDQAAVSDVSANSSSKRQDPHLSLSLPENTDYRYVKIDDPWKGKKQLIAAYRGDGSLLPMANVWLSKTRNDQLQWRYSINFFLPPGSRETVFAEFSTNQHDNNGQIIGRVFHDKDGNGLVDKGEKGIAKVPVTLKGIDDHGRQWLRSLKTNSAGRFSFNQVGAGNWTVTVGHHPGYTDGKTTQGTSSGLPSTGQIREIRLLPGEKVNNLLFAKQATTHSGAGHADLAIKWFFPPIMAQSNQPWSLILVVSNLSAQPAKNVRVQMPWPISSISHRQNRSWSIENATLLAHSSRWRSGEWQIGNMAANSQMVLVVDAFMRIKSRPQKLSFFAQVGSENIDDNLHNNVAQYSLLVSEYQRKNPLDFNFAQWSERWLAEQITTENVKPSISG